MVRFFILNLALLEMVRNKCIKYMTNKILSLSLALFLLGASNALAFSVRDPFGFWKSGRVPLSFVIECIDLESGKPLREVTIQIQEDENSVARLEFNMQLKDGKYHVQFETATLSGQTYIKLPSLKTYRTFGYDKQFMIFRFTAHGYYDRFISIPKNQVIVDEDVPMEVKMMPLGNAWERGVSLAQAQTHYPAQYHDAIDKTSAYFVKTGDDPSEWLMRIDLKDEPTIYLKMWHKDGIARIEDLEKKGELLLGNPSGRDGQCKYDLEKKELVGCRLWQ